LPTPVDDSLLNDIFTDAMTAPSWSNLRSFMVGVATGDRRDRISAEILRRWAVVAPARARTLRGMLGLLVRPWAWPISDYRMVRPYPKELDPRSRKVGAEIYAVMGIDRDNTVGRDAQTASNYKFFGAPVEIFFFAHKSLGVYSVSDVSFFAQNLMLSAQARGLATCAQGSVAMWSKAVRQEFKVPRHYKLAYGLAIGYASDNPINSYGAERLPISDITVDGVETPGFTRPPR